MGCKQWNDEWVARLYDELDPAEEARLQGHLRECAVCRVTLEELESSRQLLAESAPAVPLSPRMVVMPRPTPLRSPFWAFAAGAACASLLFFAGLFAGTQWSRGEQGEAVRSDLTPLGANEQIDRFPPAGAQSPAQYPPPDQVQQVVAKYATLEDRVKRFEAVLPEPDTDGRRRTVLSQRQLEEALLALRQQLQGQQVRDFEFLLEEISATENRANEWADETRGMLRYIMLATNPEVRAR